MKAKAKYQVVLPKKPVVRVPTGKTDADGRALFTVKSEQHKPGSIFDIDDLDVARRLLEAGAIEILDAGYDELIEAADEVLRQERLGPPVPATAPKAETWPKPRFPDQTWIDKNSFEDIL